MNSEEIIANIHDIYKRYPVPLNLQKHLLRVAAIGAYVANNWKGPRINKTDLVAYLLLHDIGNIVKFDFKQADMYEADVASDLEGWKKRQQEIVAKYGKEDHQVMAAIARELGAAPRILHLLQHNDFFKLDAIRTGSDWEQKIGKYADLRVAPFGVVSLAERFKDIKKRYAGRVPLEKVDARIDDAYEIEKQVLSNTSLKAEDINDEAIKKYVDSF